MGEEGGGGAGGGWVEGVGGGRRDAAPEILWTLIRGEVYHPLHRLPLHQWGALEIEALAAQLEDLNPTRSPTAGPVPGSGPKLHIHELGFK